MNTTKKVTKLAIESACNADYATKVQNSDRYKFSGTRTDFRSILMVSPDGTLSY